MLKEIENRLKDWYKTFSLAAKKKSKQTLSLKPVYMSVHL